MPVNVMRLFEGGDFTREILWGREEFKKKKKVEDVKEVKDVQEEENTIWKISSYDTIFFKWKKYRKWRIFC